MSKSSVTTEMDVKPQWMLSTPTEWLKLKRKWPMLKNRLRNWDTHSKPGVVQNRTVTLKNMLVVSYKTKCGTDLWNDEYISRQ